MVMQRSLGVIYLGDPLPQDECNFPMGDPHVWVIICEFKR